MLYLELYLCEFALQGVLVDDLNKQRVNGMLEMGLLQQLLAFHAACNSSALVVSTAHLLLNDYYNSPVYRTP